MNILKYPLLTLIIVIEFFIIASFSVTPIEHSLMFWLVTVLFFEMFDHVFNSLKNDEI
ncbi:MULTISPECIES: hypothetical protein [Mammaliicoccus]|uniref:hypothetical protein n=1 Tax=Mammaliicoccus TaxID=2803850 RepID=UPI00163B0B74|nr:MULTISPECIES: hypothetical protein [Mammaliicoccus]MBV5103402.1 hypothetical protein [Mammaliicoccus sciuri]MCD8770827.1 hypothetical protein [Mammaliicoccus sciuri]MCJ0953537.1 hypothetical protein [Mammaliicoccus sciuri]MCJ0969785.1 hypothetical protein [Mammaliicoccus sciuri]MDT0710198.1 hypothetical protein [Mammaliicoccus sciuri]